MDRWIDEALLKTLVCLELRSLCKWEGNTLTWSFANLIFYVYSCGTYIFESCSGVINNQGSQPDREKNPTMSKWKWEPNMFNAWSPNKLTFDNVSIVFEGNYTKFFNCLQSIIHSTRRKSAYLRHAHPKNGHYYLFTYFSLHNS